jgi:hypothetical protein
VVVWRVFCKEADLQIVQAAARQRAKHVFS